MTEFQALPKRCVISSQTEITEIAAGLLVLLLHYGKWYFWIRGRDFAGKDKKVRLEKIVFYSIIMVIILVIVGFTVLFGALLLLDKFDNRYQEPEAYHSMAWKDDSLS